MPFTKNYDLSLLVGLKNNLDYSKHFYKTTRELYPNVEICFVSFGSTDGTHEWLDSLTDENVKYHYSAKNKTFSDTFNRATVLATKKYVAYLHNDIVLSHDFVEPLLKHLENHDVVSYTTIEPPIFAESKRLGLVIEDFGSDLNTFNNTAFQNFARNYSISNSGLVSEGLVFFMATKRDTLISMGGLDNLFSPMFCEDDDLILRMKHNKLNMVTCKDAVCYHFVSKTSRFSEEYKEKTKFIEWNSNKNFQRKWKSVVQTPTYNVYFTLATDDYTFIQHVEPRVTGVMLPDGIAKAYIDGEQPHTPFDMSKRVFGFSQIDFIPDVSVFINGQKWNDKSFVYIQKIHQVLARLFGNGETIEEGTTFTVDCFEFVINKWNPIAYDAQIVNPNFKDCLDD